MGREKSGHQERVPALNQWHVRVLFLVVVLLVLAAVLSSQRVTKLSQQVSKVPPASGVAHDGLQSQGENVGASVVTFAQAAKISEPDALALFRQTVLPEIWYVQAYYPIESLRQEFSNAMNNIGEGREVAMIHPCGIPNGSALASTMPFDRSFLKPMIYLHMPEWIRIGLVPKGLNEQRTPVAIEALRDALVLVLSHEYYHCHNQGHWKKDPATLTRDDLVQSELECWDYTFRNVFGPMLAGGRGEYFGPGIIQLYRRWCDTANRGNSDEWGKTIRSWAEEYVPADAGLRAVLAQ